MIYLEPLPDFRSSVAWDLNSSGDCVGNSSEGIQGLPLARATLWKNGSPIALSTSPNRSEALFINDADDIIFVQYDHPSSDSNGVFMIRSGGIESKLADVIPGFLSLIDLNDKRRVLALVEGNGDFAKLVIFDLNTNAFTELPAPQPKGKQVNPQYYGFDNYDRVFASFAHGSPYPTEQDRDLIWLPAGGTSWIATGVRSVSHLTPKINKDGFILAVVATGAPGNAIFYNLNLIAPTAQVLPHLPTFAGYPYLNIPMAANVAGVVVGTDQWNVATRYDPATNTIADLAPYFPSNYKAGYAWAINDAGVMIGHGYRAGGRNAGSVAWVLPAEAYPGPKFPSHIPDLIMRILFGVIQDGGGVGLRPSGPTPVGPLGPLSPAKSDMLAALAVGELADLFTNPELKEMVANLEIELLTKGVAKLKRR